MTQLPALTSLLDAWTPPSNPEEPAPPTAHDRFASLEVHQEVTLFLARESELLDARRFSDWLKLVTDDFTFFVPTPRTPENPFAPHYDIDAMLTDESRTSLAEQWFSRFEPDLIEIAWGDNPPVRYRHLVGNVRVRETSSPDVYDVRSNVMMSGTRQSDAPKFITAERFDTVVRGSEGLRLARRFAVLDHTVIDFPQLRIVL